MVRVTVCVVFALTALVAAPRHASAGRTYYGWLYGTEVMPERGVELQTWVLERDGLGDTDLKESSLWVGPLVGVTDKLELAFPVEFEWTESDLAAPDFTMKRYGVEARYRFVSNDPVEAGPIVPLARIALKRDVTVRDATLVEADLVASYESGRFHALVDAGMVASITSDAHHFQARPGAGVSIRTVGDLRLGAELYGELDLDTSATRWLAIGPNLAWTHGRFWLSAAYGIGIVNITAAPRMMWGISF